MWISSCAESFAVYCCKGIFPLLIILSNTMNQMHTVKYSVHQMNTIRCQSRSKCSLTYSPSPPASLFSPILLHFRGSVLHGTVRPLHDACSAPLTSGSVQKWEYHLPPFQWLISLSSTCKSVNCFSVFITKWLQPIQIIEYRDSHLGTKMWSTQG